MTPPTRQLATDEVERVAKALWKHEVEEHSSRTGHPMPLYEFGDIMPPVQEGYFRKARAAIAAALPAPCPAGSEVEELRGLSEAATQNEWRYNRWNFKHEVKANGEVLALGFRREADAVFVAASVNYVRKLLERGQ